MHHYISDEDLQRMQESEMDGYRRVDGRITDISKSSREAMQLTFDYVMNLEGDRDNLLKEVEMLKDQLQDFIKEDDL